MRMGLPVHERELARLDAKIAELREALSEALDGWDASTLSHTSDPSKRGTTTVHDDDCYICRDPEFAMMGLPLCYACSKCKGHVPADDCICTVCGHDQRTDEGIVS